PDGAGASAMSVAPATLKALVRRPMPRTRRCIALPHLNWNAREYLGSQVRDRAPLFAARSGCEPSAIPQYCPRAQGAIRQSSQETKRSGENLVAPGLMTYC